MGERAVKIPVAFVFGKRMVGAGEIQKDVECRRRHCILWAKGREETAIK